MKLRWKTLNPNQKTHTKLGRPRLLPTDQIDNQELGYSSSSSTSYFSDESKSVTSTPVMPTPPSSTESDNNNLYHDPSAAVQNAPNAGEVLPEPIVGGDDSDEEMSSEDIRIFKAFLRGQSSGSMRLDGSFRNLLSMAEIPEEMAKQFPGMAGISGASSRSLGRGSSISWAPIEATGEARSQSSRGKLVTMMSLGSVRSASLRSLTEVDPYFAGDDLNRQLSGMSLIEGMGGEADDDNQVGTGETANGHGEFISKMDSFEDAQLIAEAMLNPVMTKTSFTEQLNGTGGYMSAGSDSQVAGEVNEALLNEFFNPETDSVSANATTVSVQDFYNGDVTLDLLSDTARFEI